MKSDHSITDFANHIVLLYRTFAKPFLEEQEDAKQLEQEASPSRRLRPGEITALYMNKQLQKYIDMCITDKRPQIYIDNLKEAATYTMTKEEFAFYLKKIARREVRSATEVTIEERQRVPRNEIKALLAAKKIVEAVNIYEAVWGYTKTIREDFATLAESWNDLPTDQKEKSLQTLFVKYGNRRGYRKKVASASDSNTESSQPTQSEEEGAHSPSPTPIPTPIPAHPFTQPLPEKHTEVLATAQWKVSNIWSAFQTNTEQLYKKYLESTQNLLDFEARWEAFVSSVKGCSGCEDAEIVIKTFIKDLRTVRHNALCYEKNTEKLLSREDRQVWRTDTILRAFDVGDLSGFKEFTEKAGGDSPSEEGWCKRWNTFVKSVQGTNDINQKKSIISKFLAAQRTKKYRRTTR